MANLLQALLDPPVFHKLPFKEMQKRLLFNRGCTAGAFFCLFFTIIGLIGGQNLLAALTAFDMIALIAGVAINTMGNFSLARHLSFNASMILFVGSNYFYGAIVHTEIYIFVFPAITVFVFDDKKIIAAYCVYLLSLFMLCIYFQKHFTGTIDGDAKLFAKFAYMNYVFAFSLLTILVYSFKSESIENSRKIEAQKMAIEEKNSEITASITYAKRVQDSLLTPHSLLDKYIADYFLFFNPKDIVSGDFYWMHTQPPGSVLLAIGDCTGHGVPGAFVSSICIGKLKEATTKSDSPARILEMVNREIKFNLNQTGNENVRDGMDVVLCHINFATKTIRYAGANRPLWILKKGITSVEELQEIKADKVSIGGFTEETQSFTEKEIALNEGDTVYLATDGFADQFGGNEGKKLTTKRLKEWVVANNNLPIKELGDKLSKSYADWRGKHEQIDDVTVMAIRV